MNRKEKKKKKLGSMLCILRYIHMYRLKNIFTTQYTDEMSVWVTIGNPSDIILPKQDPYYFSV